MNINEQMVYIPSHKDQSGREIQMRRILGYRDYLKGADDVLLLGAGPSGARWRDHVGPNTYLMACNSSILDCTERADAFACVEATAFDLPWYYAAERATRFVSYKNIEYDSSQFDDGKDVVPVERSWHMAGFNPREYVNLDKLDIGAAEAEDSPYYKCHTQIGYDQNTRIEYGLIKGPVPYPWNMAIGTILSAGLHLLCFMGVRHVKLLGFDLSYPAPPHFAEPTFRYIPSRWVPPECFIHINGIPTLWHFAMTAAWINSMRQLFGNYGMTWENRGGGLLDAYHIENLLNQLDEHPRSQWLM